MSHSFTPTTVRALRRELDAGASPRRLALLHGVSTETMRRIARRETYVGEEWEPMCEVPVKAVPAAEVSASLDRLQNLLKEDGEGKDE